MCDEKIVKSKQCNILWQVDDLKMSHVDPEILPSVPYEIDAEHVNIVKTITTWGKIHNYLGMTIDYSSLCNVKLSMVDCIGNMIDDIPEDTRGESATPSAHHLFVIAEDATKLYRTDANIFYNFVAQILYLSEIS